MAKPLRPKQTAPQKKQDSGKSVQKHTEINVRFMLSNGNGNRHETVEEVEEKLRQFVRKEWPSAHFTPASRYYIVDGKVCRVEDFDHETMDRKPGTYPPDWSMTNEERAEVLRQKRIAENAKQTNDLAKQPVNLPTSRELDERKKQPKPKEEVIAPSLPPAALKRRVSKPLRRKG